MVRTEAGTPNWSIGASEKFGSALTLDFPFAVKTLIFWSVTVDMFKQEIAEALKAYDKYIVCVDKTPEDCEASLRSLMEKAIKAYENRGPHLRHGIALDRQLVRRRKSLEFRPPK